MSDYEVVVDFIVILHALRLVEVENCDSGLWSKRFSLMANGTFALKFSDRSLFKACKNHDKKCTTDAKILGAG